MAKRSVNESIERANTLHAYVGVHKNRGPDSIGRISVGSALRGVYNLRRVDFGVKDRTIYLRPSNGNQSSIFSLGDYVLEEEASESFYRLLIDSKSRITIPKEIEIERMPLVFCGKRSHIEVYSETEWKRLQRTSSKT